MFSHGWWVEEIWSKGQGTEAPRDWRVGTRRDPEGPGDQNKLEVKEVRASGGTIGAGN